MEFGLALHAVKNGRKICRDGWRDGGVFAVYQRGYPDGIPCNRQTAEAWGMQEGEPFKCNPYLQIRNEDGTHSMWTPSVDEILADDWEIMD